MLWLNSLDVCLAESVFGEEIYVLISTFATKRLQLT